MNLFGKFEIEKGVFYPPAVLLGVTLIFGLFFTDGFAAAASSVLSFMLIEFGWMFLLFVFIFFIGTLAIMISPIGNIRLGGKNAKPEMSVWSWCVIAICAGIATAMVFWGVAEPLTHFNNPPAFTGAEALTPESAVRGLQIAVFHWAYIPYSLFTLFGLAIGFAAYNLNLPFRVSSSLYPLLGDRIYGLPGKFVDGLSIFALIGGVITSLGFGTMQFAAGLDYMFGIVPTNTVYVSLIVLLTVAYTVSSYTGLQKGIKLLSNVNSIIYIFLVMFLFTFGPTRFLLNLGVETMGSYLVNLIPTAFNADAFNVGQGWNGGWTIFFWAWWVAYAPIVGMFLARIAIGRTIRSFVIVNVMIPGTFVFLWFTGFGGSAIYFDFFNSAGIMDVINASGLEVAMYALLQNMPIPMLTIPLGIMALGISFVTLADSMTSTIAVMTTKNTHSNEPPAAMKIFWGLMTGAVTVLCLLVAGTVGTQALQTMSIVSSFPIFFIELAVLISVVIMTSRQFINKYNSEADKVIDLEEKTIEKKDATI
ncbi:choline/glycine/proline betaine transport protein [Dethiosulfatibacter aminovorans DSM 17477]|uniref:Choline/glycine/proline betaine transport protein n=1 Tax=Dethiosulfatibacter aminovorans DSM 17477 TaxID=1121476 RepID=A0A1M6K9P9_9FIRM|nr:BCCT family transporter [Dethiosulfatibacter aminovorans]SHJ55587.1 choline/glycine/proline betaine transport protein [Dethiosulfatibacter aminovorans DSM 17477]